MVGMTLTECTWTQAREAARECSARLASELVPVAEATDRVLADQQVARCDLPSFDSSAMDGWAVSGEGPWQQIGDARAGVPFPGVLSNGEAVRIATGAVVPPGATSILRWEQASVADGVVHGSVTPGADIRRAGEEVRTGDVIADAGTRITPALAGFLAACGHDQVPVVLRPRVLVLLLGDELLHEGIPAEGRVRDSLGPQLPGWLERLGAHVVGMRHVRDEIAEVSEAFAAAGQEADVIVTTGGTAAGPRDHVHAAIQANAGELVVDRVAVRPGHPMLLARLDRTPLVGLPGNPHSAVVGLMTLAEPIVHAQLGVLDAPLPRVRAATELRTTPGHTRLIAGVIADGAFTLSPYGGSAMLRGLAQSTGFAVVDANVQAGDPVRWLALPT
jgi:molybdopterin molybdotransferase